MKIRVVDTHDALLPLVRHGAVEIDDVAPRLQLLLKCVKVVHFKVEFHVVGFLDDLTLRNARQPAEVLLDGKAAGESNVFPEVKCDGLVKQFPVKPFGDLDVSDREQCALIFHTDLPPKRIVRDGSDSFPGKRKKLLNGQNLMKKIRFIPYGYTLRNGRTIIERGEADVIREIFDAYIGGASLKCIAEQLTERRIPYSERTNIWDKARIARIIDNAKYIGDGDYDPIIDEDMLNKYTDSFSF